MKPALIPVVLVMGLTSTASAQEYVNIGEYQDGMIETVVPAPYEIITLPAPVETVTEIYVPPPAYTETVPLQPVAVQPMPLAQPDFGTAIVDQEYESARLAAYDMNGDGRITTAEAIATLKPLTE